MSARRELRLAVLLCLLGSAFVLLAVGRTWITYRTGGLTIDDVTAHVSGSRVRPSVRGLGLVGLAGVLALAATRSWGRVVVGALVAAAGVAIVAVVVGVLQADPQSLVPLLDCGRPICTSRIYAGSDGPKASVVWPVLSAAGGGLLVLGGLLVAARGRRWAALSSSYEVAGPALPPVTDKGVWDALDRGDDPTA